MPGDASSRVVAGSDIWYAWLGLGTNCCKVLNLVDGAGLTQTNGYSEKRPTTASAQFPAPAPSTEPRPWGTSAVTRKTMVTFTAEQKAAGQKEMFKAYRDALRYAKENNFSPDETNTFVQLMTKSAELTAYGVRDVTVTTTTTTRSEFVATSASAQAPGPSERTPPTKPSKEKAARAPLTVEAAEDSEAEQGVPPSPAAHGSSIRRRLDRLAKRSMRKKNQVRLPFVCTLNGNCQVQRGEKTTIESAKELEYHLRAHMKAKNLPNFGVCRKCRRVFPTRSSSKCHGPGLDDRFGVWSAERRRELCDLLTVLLGDECEVSCEEGAPAAQVAQPATPPQQLKRKAPPSLLPKRPAKQAAGPSRPTRVQHKNLDKPNHNA